MKSEQDQNQRQIEKNEQAVNPSMFQQIFFIGCIYEGS